MQTGTRVKVKRAVSTAPWQGKCGLVERTDRYAINEYCVHVILDNGQTAWYKPGELEVIHDTD